MAAVIFTLASVCALLAQVSSIVWGRGISPVLKTVLGFSLLCHLGLGPLVW